MPLTVPASRAGTDSFASGNVSIAAPAAKAQAISNATRTTAARPGPSAGMFAELFALMNADRGARGLAPLAWDDRLAANAQSVSDTMAESEFVAPKDLDAILALGFTRAGENVLISPYAATAVSIEYGWMNSSAHRAAILDAGVQHVGIGATSSRDGQIWIAVDFGGAA